MRRLLDVRGTAGTEAQGCERRAGSPTTHSAQQVLAEIPGQMSSREQSTIALAQALIVEQNASLGPLCIFSHQKSQAELDFPLWGRGVGKLAINAIRFSH